MIHVCSRRSGQTTGPPAKLDAARDAGRSQGWQEEDSSLGLQESACQCLMAMSEVPLTGMENESRCQKDLEGKVVATAAYILCSDDDCRRNLGFSRPIC